MENEKRLSDAELTTPPGEGPGEQNFAIQKEKSYTDEVLMSKIEELKTERQKKLEVAENLIMAAKTNLKKMYEESHYFRQTIERLLPRRKLLWWRWREKLCFGCDNVLHTTLCIKLVENEFIFCNQYDYVISAKRLIYTESRLYDLMTILSDPKKIIDYFAEKGWLNVE